MQFIKYIETVRDKLFEYDIIPGQLIYIIDTNETMYDTKEYSRILLEHIIYLNKEIEKEEIISPLLNRIYIVKESKTAYRYEGVWYKVKDEDRLLCAIFHNEELIPITIKKGNKKEAPVTLATCVYNDNGETIDAEIESTDKLTLCKTKYVYVEATEDDQKVIKIPFPLLDYDFRKNFMNVIIDGFVVEPNRYTVRDDEYFVLNDNELGLSSGQLVLFLFYYNVYIDINDGVLLSTKNLRDRSVTEPKLADNAVSSRTIINKNVTNIKLADDSADSRVLANNSVQNNHVVSINADKIVEDNNNMFVSQEDITKWNKTSDDFKASSKIHVSATDPTTSKDGDLWIDVALFIFKVKVSGSWLPMGAVYK